MAESMPTSGTAWNNVQPREVAGFVGVCFALSALFGGCAGRPVDGGDVTEAGRGGASHAAAGQTDADLGGANPTATGGADAIVGGAAPTAAGGATGAAGTITGKAGESTERCDSPTDPHNCGRCGHDCTTLPYVNPAQIACVNGECSYGEGACLPGFAHCSGEEGCRDDLTTVNHCGSCENQCAEPTRFCSSPAGVAPTCVAKCPVGTLNCGSQCVDVRSNVAHCGACSSPCRYDNGVARCEGGQCVAAGCFPGFADCSELGGCETYLDTFDNCARCGDSCSADRAAGHCEAGQCVVECHAGFESCDASSRDCETSINTASDCGACGQACSGQRPLCSGGTCVAECAGPQLSECSGACVNLTSDPAHCGACDAACQTFQACVEGSCSPRYVRTSFLNGADVMPNDIAMGPDGSVFVSTDTAVMKLNRDGSLAWTRGFAGEGTRVGLLALTPSGSVVLSLGFRGTIDLDPTDQGTELHTAPTDTAAAAIVALADDGSFVWARSFPAVGEPFDAVSEPGAVAIDSSGAIYVTGLFRGGLQLEPGASPLATSHALSGFLLKLAPNGDLVWARAFNDCELDLGVPVIDAKNVLWVGSTLMGACQIEPGNAASQFSATSLQEGVLLRFDALSGAYVGGRAEPSSMSFYRMLAVDGHAGFFLSSTDQDEQSQVLTIDTAGAQNLLWSQKDLDANSMAPSPEGGLVVIGNTRRGPGPLPEGLFVTQLDAAGQPLWMFPLANRYALARAVAANATDFVIVGNTSSTSDFDPGETNASFGPGIFISRYAF